MAMSELGDAGDLAGQVAVISGGARGMGRSHAGCLAQAGADVVWLDGCADMDTIDYPLASVADLHATSDMVTAMGRQCLALEVDVRDYDRVAVALAKVKARFARCDILIANAGISGGGPIQTADVECSKSNRLRCCRLRTYRRH